MRRSYHHQEILPPSRNITTIEILPPSRRRLDGLMASRDKSRAKQKEFTTDIWICALPEKIPKSTLDMDGQRLVKFGKEKGDYLHRFLFLSERFGVDVGINFKYASGYHTVGILFVPHAGDVLGIFFKEKKLLQNFWLVGDMIAEWAG
ncbi:hypothetical protein AVEN_27530-1 [Araneus ventricosus]|uniref:Uncharacterized protein n=1 Tax=Araneus ventricosus TaxID=182803 RepID=A0A4Y2J9Z4_ARAVE|nr:hypothetical protein AVEN_27530-1 [Araneus ventricosus]